MNCIKNERIQIIMYKKGNYKKQTYKEWTYKKRTDPLTVSRKKITLAEKKRWLTRIDLTFFLNHILPSFQKRWHRIQRTTFVMQKNAQKSHPFFLRMPQRTAIFEKCHFLVKVIQKLYYWKYFLDIKREVLSIYCN